MLDPGALASVLLSGAAVESTECLQKGAQLKGVEVSFHPGDVDQNAIVANNFSFPLPEQPRGIPLLPLSHP